MSQVKIKLMAAGEVVKEVTIDTEKFDYTAICIKYDNELYLLMNHGVTQSWYVRLPKIHTLADFGIE